MDRMEDQRVRIRFELENGQRFHLEGKCLGLHSAEIDRLQAEVERLRGAVEILRAVLPHQSSPSESPLEKNPISAPEAEQS